MKKFLYKIIIILFAVLLVFIISDFIVTRGLKKDNSDTFIEWNQIYSGKINADIIVNGSSKAYFQVSPIILDSILELNSYNLGMDGYFFYMQKSKYDLYLEHNSPPDLIVQVVSHETFGKRDDLYKIEQFLPYIRDSIIRNVTKDYEGFNCFDYHLPFVRYFGHTITIMQGLSSFFGFNIKEPKQIKGYYGKSAKWDESFRRFTELFPEGVNIEIAGTGQIIFESFIKEQKENGIPVILVIPPTYIESQQYIRNLEEIIEYYRNFARNNDLLILDYSELYLVRRKEYFYNSQHLNKNGSEIFSAILAEDINNWLRGSI